MNRTVKKYQVSGDGGTMPHEDATSETGGSNLEDGTTEDRATEEQIRARTYQLFEEQICREGHAEFDWQQAEADVLAEQSEQSEQSGQSENIDAQ